MSDLSSQSNAEFVPSWEVSPRIVFFMSGFNAVNSGNDEYILLTPADRETGDIRQFFQLPNDPGTLKEMSIKIADANNMSSYTYVCPSLVESFWDEEY